ncbi:MAG: Rieske 2Fe-2S domain-containing protein [Nitrososphaerales archaeon]
MRFSTDDGVFRYKIMGMEIWKAIIHLLHRNNSGSNAIHYIYSEYEHNVLKNCRYNHFDRSGATIDEIPEGEMKTVDLSGEKAVIANVNGKYQAIGAICTHQEYDLSEGTLEDDNITCRSRSRVEFDDRRS